MDKPFLGTGWSFPPNFEEGLEGVEMVSGEQDINQSLTILFSTAIGERLMQSRYGSNLQQFVFQPLNEAQRTLIQYMIETAIRFYEPRIDAERINITYQNPEGKLNIEIEYKIRETNSRYNFVFDYYLKEGEIYLP